MTPEECAKPCDLKERTKEKYDVQWKGQDHDAAAERRKSLSMVADPLIRMVQPLLGKTVADLGIGTGSLAFRVIELGAPGRMVGIDFSRTGLCLSKSISHQPRFGETDIELVQADLERIPLADKSVDVVISQATINLLPNKSLAMREIARISRPGAKVAISDAFRTSQEGAGESWEQCIGGAVTVSEFSSLALEAGLIISNQVDLTQQVKTLVNAKKWDWPEFLQHNMDYRAFLLLRA
jgi:ubiquinone/menaquinone biosynthesis C-methylase UbiE